MRVSSGSIAGSKSPRRRSISSRHGRCSFLALRISRYIATVPTGLAGMPATIVPSATSRFTTLPADTIAFGPIVTLGWMMQPSDRYTLSRSTTLPTSSSFRP
jgi:hypothetical protein